MTAVEYDIYGRCRRCVCGAIRYTKNGHLRSCNVKSPCKHDRLVMCCSSDGEQFWGCHGCGIGGRGKPPDPLPKDRRRA